MKTVERIGCLNSGLFVMSFGIRWLDADGAWQESNWSSGNFENGLYRVSPPLDSIGVPSTALAVTPLVSVVLGETASGTPLVQAACNGRLAAYEVTGTTLDVAVNPLPWRNWAQNIQRVMSIDGEHYYSPRCRDELRQVILAAGQMGATVRVSGQRHAQPPLVSEDSRGQPDPRSWLIDLSCYRDLGDGGAESMVLNADAGTVTVNTGVREDELDAFLTARNWMLKTVTAGGFFSLGGMTAVDVHGATVDAPIFAETVTAFSLMGPDGAVSVIDRDSPSMQGWSPLQFARVSLGALGVVTSVTIEVMPRPWATTLSSGRDNNIVCSQLQDFIAQFQPLLATHDRIESFFNPYTHRFLALWWDIVDSPAVRTPNLNPQVPNACQLAGEEVFGAPYLIPVEPIIELPLIAAQYAGKTSAAKVVIDAGFLTIETLFDAAAEVYSDLWLTKASRVIFMSYFIELPGLDAAGLTKAWAGLQAVVDRLQKNQDFLLVAPMEFRFIRGGDTALAGTYSSDPAAVFVNLDLIAYVPAVPGADYPSALLQFFADIERAWRALGGVPHSGKMYGFYDPAQSSGTYSAPFNPAFVNDLAQRRAERTAAFEAYRKSRDPNGVFLNPFVAALLGHSG